MPVELSEVSSLVAAVAGFYIRDRAMRRAQKKIEDALHRGQVTEQEIDSYAGAVRRYFGGFSREADAHLKKIDRELQRVQQVQFNLTAERGVAVRRLEATQTVLSALDRIRTG